jgi:outer membrane protein assembly factor BamB
MHGLSMPYPHLDIAQLHLRALTFSLCIALIAGCGDCSGSATTNGPNAAADAASDADDRGDADDLSDTTPGPDSALDEDADSGDAGSDAQTCAAANRCAGACCASDQLCLRDRCVSPGSECAHNLECGEFEVCEPSVGRCIPDPGVACTYVPETEIFDPAVTMAWTDREGTVMPAFNQVMMAPTVIDLNEDETPDIIFATFDGTAPIQQGILRAIDGKTYEPIFNLTDAARRVAGISSLAAGDIDNDGRVELVAFKPYARGLIVFDDYQTDWAVMWENSGLSMQRGGPVLVDLDADGQVEVVVANRVYDARTGALRCEAEALSGVPQKSTVADVDGDGDLDVIAANGAFEYAPANQVCPNLWTYEDGGDFPAVGDFGAFSGEEAQFGVLDGLPEIVTVNTDAANQIVLHDGRTGETIWQASFPTLGHPHFTEAQCTRLNGGGPPTVADFDGDGAPEVGAAGACYYVVIDTDGTLLWKFPSQDFSSRTTGSSVFDFQGDGKAEVVYADECFLRVYDGTTGDVLFQQSHSSGTTRELPVIVDVDNDFHAEIVFIANDYKGETRCQTTWAEYDDVNGPKHGLLVVEDAQDRWVSTRPLWNQHAYHVTNVCDGRRPFECPGRTDVAGAIPIGKRPNWTEPGLNNFRQNVQGEGLFNAPDLAITNLATDCDSSEGLTLFITISNLGTRGIEEGAKVAVYVTYDGGEQYLTTLTTTERLLPGGAQTLEYLWVDAPDVSGQQITVRAVADADQSGAGRHFECDESNNEATNQATCACEDHFDCSPGEVCVNTGECLPMDG